MIPDNINSAYPSLVCRVEIETFCVVIGFVEFHIHEVMSSKLDGKHKNRQILEKLNIINTIGSNF